LPHRAFVFPAENFLAIPKSENSVFLERSHETNDSFALKERHLPLDRFFDVRTAAVHQFSQMIQDRPRERLGALNISVNAWIFFCHPVANRFRVDAERAPQRCRRACAYGSTSDCERK